MAAEGDAGTRHGPHGSPAPPDPDGKDIPCKHFPLRKPGAHRCADPLRSNPGRCQAKP